MTKLKLILLLSGVIIAILSIILLCVNNWSFNVYVAIGFASFLTTILILLCAKDQSFSLAFCSLFFSCTVYVYAIGYFAKLSCANVISVKADKTRTERYYIPSSTTTGKNHIQLQRGHSYILNNSQKSLYLTKIAYGEEKSLDNNISIINNGEAKDVTNEKNIFWFVSPREKIKVIQGTKGEYVTYVNFQAY